MEVLCQIWNDQNPVASPSTRMISGITLLRCEMYRWHFSGVTVLQNRRIPFTSSSLVFGFTSLRMNSCINRTRQSCGSVYKLNHNYMHTFSSCHKFSMGFASGLSGGFPPVDGVVLKKLLSVPGSVFRIVILHKSMPSRINLADKRN